MKGRGGRIVFWGSFFVLILCTETEGRTVEVDFSGQASGWISANRVQGSWEEKIGARYIPQVNVSYPIHEGAKWDSEGSLNGYATAGTERDDEDMDVDLYRLWLRYAAPQFEFRLGLQKITFGSARILRPLMWFDRIDPRDPLQLTDGVYGLLFRYFFLDNTNLWAWGLYGNGDTKGWEALPSDSRRPEYGGRVQTPFLTGEVALSFHHRTADAEEAPGGGAGPGEGSIPEDRIGLDGKWDLGVGVWVEGVLVRKDISGVVQRYQRFVTLGMDYTFDFGNGLTVLGEHFNLASADRAFGGGEDVSISALSVNYPLGPMDSVTGILYYDWENEDWYRFVNWQRRYDNWSFYVMGFWNPEQFQIQQRVEARGTYAGKGMQVMVVFNH